MCDILFKLGNNVIDDMQVDRESAYKSGYAVIVQPDHHGWSISESRPSYRRWRTQQLYGQRDYADLTSAEQSTVDAGWTASFVIVHVPGVDASSVAHITHPQTVDDSGLPYVLFDGGEFLPRTYRLREWWVNPATLPVAMVSAIRAAGELTVDLAALQTLVTRIRDGAPFEVVT